MKIVHCSGDLGVIFANAQVANLNAARILGLAERTAKRIWAYARAWLYGELKRSLWRTPVAASRERRIVEG